MRSNYTIFCLVLFCMLGIEIASGCNKSAPEGTIEEGKIALTFDDNYIENWHHYLPLLDSLNIKATFYICRYHTFSKIEKEKLRTIAAHGHEIAYHTTNHIDLQKELKKGSLLAIMTKEIEKDLHLMQQDGYDIENFAYPYGSHCPELDVALLRTFKSIRALSNRHNCMPKALVKQSGDKQIFYGADIDTACNIPDNMLTDLMDNARSHHDCLILTAHEIQSPNAKYHITVERLYLLAKEAAKRNLRFVTVKEIAY